jgi:uncharacterized membrane protein YraQ (UPF0718 family)
MDLAFQLLRGGLANLGAYLAAHVLLCLLPAFFIAGAITALVPKARVTRWLGRTTPAYVAYPAAAAAGSLLAVCSCTIVPLFAGIYRKGAGLGPAVTFLFFAPAGNILALSYTGSILGAEFAAARLVLCLLFGIGIGLSMALLFRRDDESHDSRTDTLFAGETEFGPAAAGLFVALIALLIGGTLQLWPLTSAVVAVELPLPAAAAWQAALFDLAPFDAAKGEEGISLQGALLIGLLVVVAATAWKGFDDIIEGADAWTWAALGLVAATLLLATLRLVPDLHGLGIVVTGRLIAVALALCGVAVFARRLAPDAMRAWLWETWRFARQIMPLLIVGVFAVGVIRQLIRPEWIQGLAGRNDLLANTTAVVFGVFMYFPTLVEVPVARMLLDLGMHRGPLLAYLMADPELSLQSILMVSVVIGRAKTFAYVSMVAVFSIAAGLLYGAFVDGVASFWLALGLAAFAAGLTAVSVRLHGHRRAAIHPP